MILGDAKVALRISKATTMFDDEINDLVAAAQMDLQLAGVLPGKVQNDTDPLIKRALIVYCKANFGFDNPDADRLQASYTSLKAHLTLSQEYTVAVDAP